MCAATADMGSRGIDVFETLYGLRPNLNLGIASSHIRNHIPVDDGNIDPAVGYHLPIIISTQGRGGSSDGLYPARLDHEFLHIVSS